MKSKWLNPRARVFQRTRMRRRAEADGCGFSPAPPQVHGYQLAAPSSAGEMSRRILLRLALLGALLSTQLFAAHDCPESSGQAGPGISAVKPVSIHGAPRVVRKAVGLWRK